MSHLTLYLDRETERLVRTAASGSHTSVSKWIASAARLAARAAWPDEICRLSGSWQDFPDAKVLRRTLDKDLPRRKF